jgi:alkylation response protein AidB-like acyl-CoA dehydrogenase
MDFTFSEEQRMMAAALRELAADVCSPHALRAVFDGTDAAAAERWTRLGQLGLFGVLAPEGCGGMGLADVDFVLLAEEAGRAALPEPLTEQAALAVPLLAELASVPAAASLLPQVATGAARVAVMHEHNPLAQVPPQVTHWLLCSDTTVRLAGAGEVTIAPVRSLDAGLQLCAAQLAAGRGTLLASAGMAQAASGRLLNRGAVQAAAQALGVAERLLELAAAYAKERVQFGKPVGAYQAIKHHLASVAVKLEFARAVVYAAATRLAHLDVRACVAASHAKLAAVAAADQAARSAIQVHGAMGYSWELDLHFYMKRAWSLAGRWGDHNFHARRVQSLVCGGALGLGPDQTFAATS